ncbi:hypothetical protein [Conexibacter sp. SYSU D00693]|uniref:hypothetical protein n=1 Tax=Conexibacter sp. SYSU D00693 TaxID=2812560 RepID=UPI00196B6F83|nr:hypothetical protein [Conexibacter sp. SYSU D00693]
MSTRGTKTYRGRSLEELVPQIKAELGEDAVIVDRREALDGGVGGFFQKRVLELDAAPAAELERFAAELSRAEADLQEEVLPPAAPAHRPHVDARVTDVTVDDLFAAPQDEGLAGLFAAGREPVAEPPAAEPSVAEEPVAEAPQAEPVVEVPVAEQPQAEPVVEVPVAEQPQPEPVVEEPVAEAPQLVVEEHEPEGFEPAPVDAPGDEAQPEPRAWAPPPVEEVVAEEPVAAQPEPVLEAPAVPEPVVTPEPVAALPQPAAAPAVDPEVEALAEALEDRGVPHRLAVDVLAEATERLAPLATDRPLRELAVAALARRIPVARLAAGPRVVALAGPGGAGKTSLAAAIAAAHAAAGLPVAALALRAPDGGAELGRRLAAAGVAVAPLADGTAARDHAAGALAVLDLPAAAPRDADALRQLAVDLRAAGADEVHLAIPATMSLGAARELLDAVGALGVTAVAITHADETAQLGTAVALAVQTGVPLSVVLHGERLEAADATALAEALVP